KARDGLLREDLLLRLGQNVRAELPHGLEPVTPALELTACEQRVGLFVLERAELEPEEEELRVDCCALLGESRDKGPTRGVVHVGREPQMRVIDRAREGRLDPL